MNETYSASYQKDDARYAFETTGASESFGFIGLGSSGKSNLLRHLTRFDVRALYTSAPLYCLVVYLDPHLMIHLQTKALESTGSDWRGYELLLSRLAGTLDEPLRAGVFDSTGPSNRNVPGKVADAYEHLMDSNPLLAQMGVRHLEDALRALLTHDERWQVIYLFDEIEEFIPVLSAEFFQSLRGIRDEFKRQLTYIYTARQRMEDIIQPYKMERAGIVMESFVELFHTHTRYISPLDPNSAAEMLQRLAQRHRTRLWPDQALFESLYDLSGGHAGLLRRSFSHAAKFIAANPHDYDQLGAHLLTIPGIRTECSFIHDSLTAEERAFILRGQPVTTLHEQALVEELTAKHVPGMKLFVDYLRQELSA